MGIKLVSWKAILIFMQNYTDKIASPTDSAKFVVAVDSKTNFKSLKIGDKLSFKDTRKKNRVLRVLEVINPTKIRVSSEQYMLYWE